MRRVGHAVLVGLLVGAFSRSTSGFRGRAPRGRSPSAGDQPFLGDQAAIAKAVLVPRDLRHLSWDQCRRKGRARARGGPPCLQAGFRGFVETVKKGRDVPGRMEKMPPWGGALSDQQIYRSGLPRDAGQDGANWKEVSR